VAGDIAGIAVIVGLMTYIHTSIRERAFRRADLVRTYSSELSSVPELVELFTQIDYNQFSFVKDQDTWLGKAPEQNLVRLFDVFNSVGHNWRRKVVTLGDIHGTTLGYGIIRAYRSDQVQAYLDYVDTWDADHLGTGVAFENFRRLAVALDKKSTKVRAKRARARANAVLEDGRGQSVAAGDRP
jgi:hypothetical protein